LPGGPAKIPDTESAVTASPTERAVLPTLSPILPTARMAELIKIFYLLAFPTLFLPREDSGASTFF